LGELFRTAENSLSEERLETALAASAPALLSCALAGLQIAHDGAVLAFVARAAAKVALEVLAGLVLGRARDLPRQSDDGQGEAGGAEAALIRAFGGEE
jgi:hypothetical protein